MIQAKKVLGMILGLALLLQSVMLPVLAEETFNNFQNFESFSNGNNNFYKETDKFYSYDDPEGKSGKAYGANIKDVCNNNGGNGVYNWFAAPAEGKVFMSARVYMKSAEIGTMVFNIMKAGGVMTPGVHFEPGGKIMLFEQKLGDWECNTWYKVEMLVDTTKSTIEALLINNELKCTNVVSSFTQVERAIIASYLPDASYPPGYYTYIDDFLVTNDSSCFPGLEQSLKLVSSIPENGAEKVLPNDNITLTFDKPVTEAAAADFEISGGAVITSTALNAEKTTVTLTLSGMNYETVYTLKVLSTLKAESGEAIAENTAIVFTTGKNSVFRNYIDFENGAALENDGDVYYKYGGVYYPTDDPNGTGNKVGYIKIDNTRDNGSGGCGIYKWYEEPVEGEILLSAKVYMNNYEIGTSVFDIRSKDGTMTDGIQFTSDRKISLQGHELGNWETNHWYKLEMIVNTGTKTIKSVYIDNVLKCSNVQGAFSNIERANIVSYLPNKEYASGYYTYHDEFLITNDTAAFPTENLKLVSSSPENQAQNISVQTAVTLMFEDSVDVATAVKENFSVYPAKEIEGVSLDDTGKICTIRFAEKLDFATEYTLTILPGLKNVKGYSIGGANQIRFTTMSREDGLVEIGDLGIYNTQGIKLENIENGLLTAEVQVANNQDTAMDATIIIAIYSDETVPQLIKAASNKTSVQSGKRDTLRVGLSVEDKTGKKVKAFLIDNLEKLCPLSLPEEIK